MMDAKYVTDKSCALIKKLHGTTIGAKEFSGGWMPERVDAILFNGMGSFLIETKISKQDFKADFKKTFRDGENGCGRYRYYACPEGLIKPEELPEKWGLIYVFPKNKRAKMIVGYGGHIKTGETKCPDKGWTIDISEYHGSPYPEVESPWNHPDSPRLKFSFENRCMEIESKYLYALATRYRSQKFMENML